MRGKWVVKGAATILAGCFWASGQSTKIDLSRQGRSADFSDYSWTKPFRTVGSLPTECRSGEMVWLQEGSQPGQLQACDGTGAWVGIGGGTGNSGVAFSNVIWVELAHNRNTKDVLVSCYEPGGAEVQPDRVVVTDSNRVEIHFAVAQSGVCVMNASGGGSGGSGAIASVFGRTGEVSGQAGDYGFTQISGVAGLSQGGTNQTAWTASRCVQVSADGSRLESAAAACGSGTGTMSSVFGRTGAVVAASGDYAFSQISGTASVSQGGTGGTTSSSARVNLLPVMTGQQGKVLMVSPGGTDAEWTTPPATTLTAGPGLVITGTVIGLDSAVVPAFLTGSSSLADWDGGADRVPAGGCAEKNFTVAGARPGDTVIAGWPSTLPLALTGIVYSGVNDLVVVRLCNATAADVSVPDGLTFKAAIIRAF